MSAAGKYDALIEAVARAIAARVNVGTMEDLDQDDLDDLMRETRAAIEAIGKQGYAIVPIDGGNEWWDSFAGVAFRNLPDGQLTRELLQELRSNGPTALALGGIKAGR